MPLYLDWHDLGENLERVTAEHMAGPAIKSRAVSDQFQQHRVRENSQQFTAIATDHGGHVVDEGMINGSRNWPIQVRSQRPAACSPPSARSRAPARDPIQSGTLCHLTHRKLRTVVYLIIDYGFCRFCIVG
jgi:hypothetical protein